jgi:hypothetical protein
MNHSPINDNAGNLAKYPSREKSVRNAGSEYLSRELHNTGSEDIWQALREARPCCRVGGEARDTRCYPLRRWGAGDSQREPRGVGRAGKPPGDGMRLGGEISRKSITTLPGDRECERSGGGSLGARCGVVRARAVSRKRTSCHSPYGVDGGVPQVGRAARKPFQACIAGETHIVL